MILLPQAGRAQTPIERQRPVQPRFTGWVVVTPDDSIVTASAGAGGLVTFFVKNTTTTARTFTLTCRVAGVVPSCTNDVEEITLDPNEQEDIDVNYPASPSGTGTISLFATDGVVSDSGWYAMTFTGPTISQPRQNDSVFNRGHCLTTDRGPFTWSCGDALYFLATPSFTTLDRARAMTLVYASNTAAPAPIVAANVTMPLGAVPDHLEAVLTVHDTVRTTVKYSGWKNATRQIALSWNAVSTATGVYPYTLTVYAVSGSDSTSASISGLTTVVNRNQSPYGAGFEWLGVERLVLSQPVGGGTGILWVDGDGSTRLYRADGANKWMSAADDGQDSIAFASSQYTLTTRHGVQVIFDNTGRHIQTKNRAGQITTFAWSSATQLDSVLLPPSGSGKSFKVQYASGRLSGVALDGGVSGRNIIDTVDAGTGTPELTSWVWPDGTKMHFRYDGNRRLTTSIFSAQDSMALAYGTNALVDQSTVYYTSNGAAKTSVTDYTPWQSAGFGLSGGTTYSASDTALALTTIDGPPADSGRVTVFHVDQWGAPVVEKDAYGTVTSYVRGSANAPGLVSEIDFPNNRQVNIYYDARMNGVPDSLIDRGFAADSFPTQKTRWVYADANDYDSPSQVTAPDGTVTHYHYNTMGLTDSILDPRGHATKYAYNTSGTLEGQLTSVTELAVPTWIQSAQTDSTKDLVTSLSYSTVGNITEVDDPAGGATRYGQDAAGRDTATTNALGFRQRHYYDAMDRDTMRVARHASAGVSSGCHTNQFTCDSTLIQATLNPVGSDSEITRFTYTLGRLTEVLDPRSVPHQYAYDERGLVVRDLDEQNRADSMTYDLAGNLLRRKHRDGSAETFMYDSLDRETRHIIPARTMSLFGVAAIAPADTTTSSYDAVGNLLTHHAGQGTITRTYYDNGAVKTMQSTDTGSVAMGDTLAYAYDAGGRLARIAWPRGDTIRYGYNATTGDLDSITPHWRNGTSTQTIPPVLVRTDVMGRRSGLTFPYYSLADTLHYDALGTLRKLLATNSAPKMNNLLNFTLLHDSVDVMGRILHQRLRCDSTSIDSTNVGAACGSWNPYDQTTRYNRVGQVVWQGVLQYAATSFTADTFHYDLSGNQAIVAHYATSGDTRKFTYPAASNRPTGAADSNWILHSGLPTTYAYDLNGSRTQDSLFDKYTQAYQYDGAGRMKGQARVEPAYVTFPGYGNRNVIDTVRSANTCGYNADGQLVRGCGVTRVSYSGANVVREHDGDWWYVLGPGLDDPVLVVKRGFVGAPGVTEAWYPVISDGHGDLLALADSAGQLQGTVLTPEYDAGIWNNSGLTGNAHAFNPRRQATPGGIDTISTFRTRQYDPATGKWLQEDQAGVAGGVNLYEYNGNDPNSFSDPFGMEALNCPDCGPGLDAAMTPIVSRAGKHAARTVDACTTYSNSKVLKSVCQRVNGPGATKADSCAAQCLARDYVQRGMDTGSRSEVSDVLYMLHHVACYHECGYTVGNFVHDYVTGSGAAERRAHGPQLVAAPDTVAHQE